MGDATPVPLDEHPIHQAPVSMRWFATTDRNVYDRCIMHCFTRDGSVELITGLGVYPHSGIIDGYATVRRGGDKQWAVRASDVLGEDRMVQSVGPVRFEVLEPLRRLRAICEGDDHGLSFDLTWDAVFPAREEPRHSSRTGDRTILDACRFVQAGAWNGTLTVDGEDLTVDDTNWSGTRDRSWGIRPVGEADPVGRPPEAERSFWWVWSPLRFDDFFVLVILQEAADGYRSMNEAIRVWGSDHRVEQLGWPELEIQYRSGTRFPERAVIHLTQRGGKPLDVEVETLGGVALSVGCGYGGDPDWTHGQWMGPGWVEGRVYDLTDPAIAGRIGFSMIDHVARATCDGQTGTGIFEHVSIGRHDPTGFADFTSVAP